MTRRRAQITPDLLERMRAMRAAGAAPADIADRLKVSASVVSKHTADVRHARAGHADDIEDMPVLRKCVDALPPLPPREPDHDDGARAFALMLHFVPHTQI